MSLVGAVNGNAVRVWREGLEISRQVSRRASCRVVVQYATNQQPAPGHLFGLIDDAVVPVGYTVHGARTFNGTSSVLHRVFTSGTVNNFTLAVWAKMSATAVGDRTPMHVGRSGNGYGFRTESGFWCAHLSGVTHVGAATSAIVVDVWTHLALRRSGGTSQFFVDGVAVGATVGTAPGAPNGYITFGAQRNAANSGFQDFFPGSLAHGLIADTALTNAQILAMAAGGPGGMGLSPDRYDPGGFHQYYPIIGSAASELDSDGANALTVVSATQTAGPPVASINATHLYNGLIEEAPEVGIAGTTAHTKVNIAAGDLALITDKRLAYQHRLSETLEARITDLTTIYLAAFGLSVHPSQVTGPTLPGTFYDMRTVTDVFNEIALQSGMVWTVDDSLQVRFFVPSTAPAPFDVISGDGNAIGDLKVTQSMARYANGVHVRAGTSKTVEKTESFTGDGSEDTWVLTYPRVEDRGYITVNGAVETLGTGATWSYDPVTNSITRTSAVPAAQVVTIIYTAQFPILVSAIGDQSGGAVEVLILKPDIFDVENAQAAADGELLIRETALVTVEYATFQSGLELGMLQTITVPTRHVDDDFIVVELRVQGHPSSSVDLMTHVVAVSGMAFRSASDFWSAQGGGDSASQAIGGGGGTVVGFSVGQSSSGNLMAQKGTSAECELGSLQIDDAAVEPLLVNGVRLGPRPGASTDHAWFLLNRQGLSITNRELAFYDNYGGDANGVAMALYLHLGTYVLGPSLRSSTFSGGLQLGQNNTGKRLQSVHTIENYALSGYTERARSVRMGEWAAYTPVWTTLSGAAPSIGNGTLTGRYTIIGKTVHFFMKLHLGSTSTVGTGIWAFSLPETPVAGGERIFGVQALQVSPAGRYNGQAIVSGGLLAIPFNLDQPSVAYLSTVPFTWAPADADSMTMNGTYEMA